MGILDFLGSPQPELLFTLIVRRDNNKTYLLPNAPKGWEGALITNSRSEQYFAMTRSYSVPIDFILDGAWILRGEFYTYGMQAFVQLQIEQLDKETQTYKIIYLGDCDFSQVVDTKDVFTVNMMDAGIESKIKAYGSTTFEIPVDVPEAIDVELTPIALYEQADSIIIPTDTTFLRKRFFPGTSIVNNEQQSVDVSVYNVAENDNYTPDFSTDSHYFYKALIQATVTFTTFQIEGRVASLPDGYIGIFNQHGVELHRIYTVVGDHINEPIPLFIDETFSIDVQQGDELFLYAYVPSAPGQGNSVFGGWVFTKGVISINYNVISPATTIKAVSAYYLFKKLIELNNGLVYPTNSYLLTTTWKQLLVTCGDAIRGFDGSVIKISWDDFWQSIDSECNASFGNQNGVAVLEGKNNAFKRTLPIMNIGEVSGFSLSMYEPYLFNTLKVGYDDQTYDQDNGRLEFNSTQNYKTPITRVQKELDLTSKIRADSIGIELTRINLSGKETKDADSDNDTFFIYVKANPEVSGAYQPDGVTGFTSITGALPGAYNFILSPKEMLYRYSNFIHGVMDKLDGDRIIFTSASKNTDLVAVTLSGKRIAEADNINISSLDTALFLPYLVTVKCALPTKALSLISNLPNGYVNFTYQGAAFRGFIIESNIDIAKNSSQEFKLLLTPDNDLTQLIN